MVPFLHAWYPWDGLILRALMPLLTNTPLPGQNGSMVEGTEAGATNLPERLASSRLPVRRGGLQNAPETQQTLHAQSGRTGKIGSPVGRHAPRLRGWSSGEWLSYSRDYRT